MERFEKESIQKRFEKGTPLPRGMVADVLVVDDEESIRDLLRKSVQHLGHRAQFAHDYETAIRLLQDQSFDIVISDYRMPGRTGVDLFRWIEAHQPDLAKNFILISGTKFGQDVIEYLTQPGTLFLEKPFRLTQLAQQINRVFLRQERLSV
jgi:DNA-binding NtrC family response regulator